MIQDPHQTHADIASQPDSDPTLTATEPAAEPASAEPLDAARLAAEVASLKDEVSRQKDQLLRAVAETENVRRRLEQQADDRGKYAISNLAKDILSVADNLRRALESIPAEARADDPTANKLAEGVELTERGLLATLERFGIKKIEAVGQRFDPHLHQAMMEIEDLSQPAGTVVLEMQAGYVLQDRLLRAAMVGVSRGGPKPLPGDAGLDTTA